MPPDAKSDPRPRHARLVARPVAEGGHHGTRPSRSARAVRTRVPRLPGRHGLDEEQPTAYKDVNEVVNVVHQAGLSKKVLRLRPLGVIKG